jgi:hypothetical protein
METCVELKKNLEEIIWTSLIPMETKVNILLAKWKALILRISPIIVKKKYFIWGMTNNMHINGEWKKKTSKMGYYNKVENVKMC